MAQRMILEVPGIASSYAVTLLNEALGLIYDMQMWSWQLQVAGWLTPGLLFPGGSGISAGTVKVTAFSDQVVGSAAASTAWQAYSGMPLFTQLQFRSPFYSLYNIISIHTVAGISTLTLDRPWMEPSMPAATYMIYQAYFAVPVVDFKRFLWARDTTNDAPMDYWSLSQKDLSFKDPERTIFDDPGYFVPYQPDQRVGSATIGQMLYELWPNPLSVLPYTYGYLRRGPLLQKPGDTVPYPLTEEAVLWRAKQTAFIYKEAQKGEQMERGMGANWQYLAGEAEDQFKIAIKPVKDRDSDLVSLYWSKWRPDYYNQGEPYATVNAQLNIGRL